MDVQSVTDEPLWMSLRDDDDVFCRYVLVFSFFLIIFVRATIIRDKLSE